MTTKQLLAALLLAIAPQAWAQTEELTILSDIRTGEPWPCLYYQLNRNADITVANKAGWMKLEEDETYWSEGVGPFSCDNNMFFITDWASEIRPILIRRHFQLQAEDVTAIIAGTLTLQTSYDEDPVIYLNGTRITSYSGWNDNNYASYTFPKARKQLLRAGDNVIAVSVKQGAGGGHIDFSLKARVKADAIDDIAHPTTDDDGQLYTLSGQRLHSATTHNGEPLPTTLPRGIYIVGGRKVAK